MSAKDRSRRKPIASASTEASFSRSGSLAALLLQIGVVASVLAVVRMGGVAFYDGPKELVANLIGLTTASLCLMSARSASIDRTDLFLGVFVAVSIVSAAFGATDRWEALRAVGLTLSGAAVFWCARYLAGSGEREPLLDAVAIAVVLVAVTIFIDAFGYGLESPHASARGTQGNRNWAAHLLALGMPLLALQSLAGQTAKRRIVSLGAIVVCAGALVLTRSRAGWIAAVLGTGVPLIILAAYSLMSRGLSSPARCGAALGALLAGIVLGVSVPTHLKWTSSSPYLESAMDIAAYNQGSGRARLKQYGRSLAMAVDHPVLGVGPGNWRIVYPQYLPKKTPPHLWYPRRSNSDWLVIAAERGMLAAILFFATLVSLALGCWRSFLSLRKQLSSWERSLEPLSAIAIMIALGVVGSLDAVIQLPAPTLLFFLAVGALAPEQQTIASLGLLGKRRILAIVTPLLVAAFLGLYLIDGIYADFLVARAGRDDLQAASRIALDSYWLYNEIVWSSFMREAQRQAAAAGRE
jgi:hypothetical protein